MVDHINKDGLDNRWSNLREATWVQNNLNRRGSKSKFTSRSKGVFKRDDTFRFKPWRASITYKGKTYHLGDYETEQQASNAYDVKASEFHKEFYYKYEEE